jgi:hypothetical protein
MIKEKKSLDFSNFILIQQKVKPNNPIEKLNTTNPSLIQPPLTQPSLIKPSLTKPSFTYNKNKSKKKKLS